MVVDLHERLSEFSYGYGATREAEAVLRANGLVATPFLPSLIHEKDIGFDVGFNAVGLVLLLQFKLGQQLQRYRRRASESGAVPMLSRPFWQFTIDLDGHQYQRLREFESNGAEVYYAGPRFASWQGFDAAYQSGKVLHRSVLLKPSDIETELGGAGSAAGIHRVVYDGSRRYVCSEPREVPEYSPEELVAAVRARFAEEGSLASGIKRLFGRDRREAPGRFEQRRLDALLDRAKTEVDGMAAAVGVEAWTQGAQLIFVTESAAADPVG